MIESPFTARHPRKAQNTEPGQTCILKWHGGRRAVFMLEFDDSAPTHLSFVIPALKRRKIPGTFYINPGNGPYKNHQAAWEKEANSVGIELANHTYSHIGGATTDEFEREIVLANDAIDLLYPERKRPRLRTWARPGVPDEQWGIDETQIQAILKKHHLIERPEFCGPPFTLKTPAEMLALVDKAISEGEMQHVIFHGVGGDWHSTSLNDFISLLDKISACASELWLTDPLSWHKYQTERDAATITLIETPPPNLRFSLTSHCDPYFYDQPLSLVTHVPASWKYVAINQAGHRIVRHAPNGEVHYEAIPDAGDITLQPATP